jgi:hypothetical protein
MKIRNDKAESEDIEIMTAKKVKIIIDICMIVFLVLSFIRWERDGAAFHFAVGSVCALFFTGHVYIHRKWIKAVTKTCFAGKLNKDSIWKYPVNMLLLLAWSVSIVAGVLAAGYFIFEIQSLSMFGRLHGITARIGLGLVAIHAVQHWKQIVSYILRKTKARYSES